MASRRPPALAPRSSAIRLALLQHASPGLDAAARRRNLLTATDMIRQAADRGADIVATQELFIAEYFCQVESDERFALAEPIPGPTTDHLARLAKKLKLHITASIFERRAPGLYHNTSVMIAPSGAIVGKYRKMHIPDDPRFYEKYYFTPGDLDWQTQNLRPARRGAAAVTTGTLVCWDQWYPEAARLTALRGAQILLYPTAIGWYHRETPADRRQQREAWQIIQRSHAIANGVFVAAINRVGVEHDLEFWGGSFVCDPGGVVLAEAPSNEPCVLLADCDLARIESIRQGWPFLRDRRIDAYWPIVHRYLG